uniref:UBX domain protein 10 n=2 Tax=Otolemur garnettii TaxID=30611 RepID=H0XJ69_OTOGA
MATEAPVNIAPPGRSTVVSATADSCIWQPNALNMHVIRPKSAKGRTRPSLRKSQDTEVGSHRTLSSPPAIPCESPSSQKPEACAPKSPKQGASDEIPELLLQQVPLGASSCLNKYPVLPSINRKNLEDGALETVAEQASSLQLSSIRALPQKEICTLKTNEASRAQVCTLEKKLVQTKRQGSPRPRNLEEPSDQEPRLLL